MCWSKAQQDARLRHLDCDNSICIEVRNSALEYPITSRCQVGALTHDTLAEAHLRAQANQIGELADSAQVLGLSIMAKAWAAQCC